MAAARGNPASGATTEKTGAGRFAADVFTVVADGLRERAETIALFTETGRPYDEWCTWEALAACRGAGWAVQPGLPYADVGVAGSRDQADLLVFDPARGHRVLVELAVIHDWSTNKWLDTLNGDTAKLRRATTVGVMGLQMILAASLDSPIDVNPQWQGWLGMSDIWNRPTKLRRAFPIGAVGQMVVRGWGAG